MNHASDGAPSNVGRNHMPAGKGLAVSGVSPQTLSAWTVTAHTHTQLRVRVEIFSYSQEILGMIGILFEIVRQIYKFYMNFAINPMGICG